MGGDATRSAMFILQRVDDSKGPVLHIGGMDTPTFTPSAFSSTASWRRRLSAFGVLSFVMLGLAGCSPLMPTRKAHYTPSPSECRATYARHAAGQPIADTQDACWQRSLEQMPDYDLAFTEFDEQGWVARQEGETTDRLTETMSALHRIQHQSPGQRISLVVYVHGWKHNAAANDSNVREFRALLQSLAIQERERPQAEQYRVVGLYVGWRGGSIDMPVLQELSFWDRKSTAKRVAGGSVQELFARLDRWRDGESSSRRRSTPSGVTEEPAKENLVRMLTIGHSMGGQILMEGLTQTFVHAATRPGDAHLSRYGDLVIVVNPAIEGTRYEALHSAARRLGNTYRPDQLPVLINVTGEADWATGKAFPAARFLNTLLENTASPEQFKANLLPPGHDSRYQTHRLSACQAEDPDCIPSVCKDTPALARNTPSSTDPVNMPADALLKGETRLVDSKTLPGRSSYGNDERYCTGAHLQAESNWQPDWNPFWTVKASEDVINGHNDIYNRHLQGFIRVMHGLVKRVVH